MHMFLFSTRRCLVSQSASDVSSRFAGRIRSEQLLSTSVLDSLQDKSCRHKWGGRVYSAARLVNEDVYKAAVSKFCTDPTVVYSLRRLANLDPRPWNIFYRLDKSRVCIKDHQCTTLLLWTSVIVQLEKHHGRKIHAIQMGNVIATSMKQRHQTGVGVACAHYRLCEVSGDLTTAFKLFDHEMKMQSIHNSVSPNIEQINHDSSDIDNYVKRGSEYVGGSPVILFHLVWLARVAVCQPSDERAEEVCQIIFDTYENQRLYRFTEACRSAEDKYRHMNGVTTSNSFAHTKEAADIKEYYNKVRTPMNRNAYMGMSSRLDLQEDELFAILHEQLLPRIGVVIETDPSSNPEVVEWVQAGYERNCLDRRRSLLQNKEEKAEVSDIDELGVPSVDALLFARPYQGGIENIFPHLNTAPRFYRVSDYMSRQSSSSPPTMYNPYILDSLLNAKLTRKLEKYAYYFLNDYGEDTDKNCRNSSENKRRQFSLLSKLIKKMQTELSNGYAKSVKKENKKGDVEKSGPRVYNSTDVATRKAQLPKTIAEFMKELRSSAVDDDTDEGCHGIFASSLLSQNDRIGYESPLFIRSIFQTEDQMEGLGRSDKAEVESEEVDDVQKDELVKRPNEDYRADRYSVLPITAEIYHYLLVALAASGSESTAVSTYLKCMNRMRILDTTRASMLGSIGARLRYPKVPSPTHEGEEITIGNSARKESDAKLGSVTENMDMSDDDQSSFLALLSRVSGNNEKSDTNNSDCFAFTSKLLQDQRNEVQFRRIYDRDNNCTNAVMNYWMCDYPMFLYYRNALGYFEDHQLTDAHKSDLGMSNGASEYNSSSGLEVFYIFVLPALGVRKLLDIIAASEIHRKLFVHRHVDGSLRQDEDTLDLKCIFASPAEYRAFKEELLLIDDDLSLAIASFLWETCSSCKTYNDTGLSHHQKNALTSSMMAVDTALDTITSVAPKLDLSLIGQIPFLSDYSTDAPIATTLLNLREKLLSYGISTGHERNTLLNAPDALKRRVIYLLDPSFLESGQHISIFTNLVKQAPVSTHHTPLILIPYPTLRQLADTAQMRGTANYLNNYLDTEVLYTGDPWNGEAPLLNEDMTHNERLDIQTSLRSLKSISQLLKREPNNVAILYFSECLMGYYYTPFQASSSHDRNMDHMTNNEKYDRWLLQIASMIKHIGVDIESGEELLDVHVCSDDPALMYRVGSSQGNADIIPAGDNNRSYSDTIDRAQLSILCEGIKFVSTNSILPALCNVKGRSGVPSSGQPYGDYLGDRVSNNNNNNNNNNIIPLKKTEADVATAALVDGHFMKPVLQFLEGKSHQRPPSVSSLIVDGSRSALSSGPSEADVVINDVFDFEPVLTDPPIVPLSEEDKEALGIVCQNEIPCKSSSEMNFVQLTQNGASDIVGKSDERVSSWMDLLENDNSHEESTSGMSVSNVDDKMSLIPSGVLSEFTNSVLQNGDGSVVFKNSTVVPILNKGPVLLGEEVDRNDLLMSPISAANLYAENMSDAGDMYGEFLSTKGVPKGELNMIEDEEKARLQRLGSFAKGTKRDVPSVDPKSMAYDKRQGFISKENTDSSKGGIEYSGKEYEDPDYSEDPRKKKDIVEKERKKASYYDHRGRRIWSLNPLEQDHLANIPLSKSELRRAQRVVSKAYKDSVCSSLQFHVYEMNVNDPRNKEVVELFRQKVHEFEKKSTDEKMSLTEGAFGGENATK